MSLFGKKEKKPCSCGGNCSEDTMNKANEKQTAGAAVKILGSGCDKCRQLEENTVRALEQLRLDTAVDHVTDYVEIASYGVMTTPALVYNGKVISYGKVLKAQEIVKLLENEMPSK